MWNVIRKVLNFKFSIIIVFLTVIGNVYCTLVLPNYLSDIVDYGITNQDMDYVFKNGAAMLVISVLGMVLNIISIFYSAKISMKVGYQIRSEVFGRVQKFSLEEFDGFSTASLITRTNNDVTQIQNFVMMFLKIILMSPIMCIGGLILAFCKNSFLSSVIFMSIPLLVVFIFLISKKALPLSTKMQQKIDKLNLIMREKLTGIKVIRAFVTEDYEEMRFKKANSDFMNNSLKMNRTIALMEPLLMLVLNASTIFLLIMCGYVAKVGDVLIGDVIAVIQYVTQIMLSVTMMSVIFVFYPRASASASRIDEIMEKKLSITDKPNASSKDSISGTITFKDVSFSFPVAKKEALKNISFEAKPGQTTAIIGSTGSGKSILVKLMMRFYDASKGEILIDGINIKDYPQKKLREEIGYVPQKALLFKGSIKENIKMGKGSAQIERVEDAAKISQAYEFIEKKEEKFEFPISQGGTNVSGGQKQRLSIARAVIKNPKIYIFDDSFSALDFKTEATLRQELSKETEDSTVVIVAQRVSTIMNADKIIVLNEGEAVGIGTHKELLETCKIYKEIVRSQMSKEEVGA